MPQVAIEGFFEQHLAAHGLDARRNHELAGLAQDDNGVTATFTNGATLRSRYLVAADGAHSTVRSLLRAGFPGQPGTLTVTAADVRLSGVDPSTSHTWNEDGHWAALFPLGTDPQGRQLRRLVLGGPGRVTAPGDPGHRGRNPSRPEHRVRHAGTPAGTALRPPYHQRVTAGRAVPARAGVPGGRCRPCPPSARRAGHEHRNAGRAQPRLETRRRRARLGTARTCSTRITWNGIRLGAAVLRNVRAQSLLMDWAGHARSGSCWPPGRSSRPWPDFLTSSTISTDLMSGMAIRYPMPGTETIRSSAGPHRTWTSARPGCTNCCGPGTASCWTRSTRSPSIVGLWSDRVDRVGQGADTEPMLIRPDGYVCWAGDRTISNRRSDAGSASPADQQPPDRSRRC